MYTLRKNIVVVLFRHVDMWMDFRGYLYIAPKQDTYSFPKSGECIDCESYCEPGPGVSTVVVSDYYNKI